MTSSMDGRSGAKDAVAIVGIGCRFPGGSNDPEAYWNTLAQATDCVGEVPETRWHHENFYHPRKGVRGKSATRWGGFVDGIDQFDAGFFGISPREAATMDPQQRLLLEVCWEAFEDACLVPARLKDRAVGVYVGAFTLDYMLQQFGDTDYRGVETHTATGSMMTLLAARLSYVYGLRGPSMAIDTACSSSLVALHLACQSLLAGESEIALAGGVNAMLGPAYTIAESQAGMLSPTGRSRAFDSRADGYTRGEGAGIVVLKRLEDALAARDHVYAVVRATAVNQDGRSPGVTVPSGEAQQALMRRACGIAGIQAKDIAYIEAHGTGTPVGDPIEAGAIGAVLGEGRRADDPCLIGSVKTNIGHTEAAAGVAALIKAAMVVERGQVPPHLHFQQANPGIDFQALKLRVPTAVAPLPVRDGHALVAVNSFGFGGTNAHAILQTAPALAARTPAAAGDGPYLLPLSARHPESLRQLAARYADALEPDGGALKHAPLASVCWTAAVGREHHAYRSCATGPDRATLVAALRALAAGQPDGNGHTQSAGLKDGAPAQVFVYSGSGPQWWGMGQQLYREEPVFKAAVDRCAELFQRVSGWDILQHMLAEADTPRANDTDVVQSAGFMLQVGLTELLAHWGIVPAAIVGHSLGEIAAAHAAGCLSLEDAVCVIYHRSRLLHRVAGQGAMLAIGLSSEAAQAELDALGDPSVSIAAINGPAQVTVAGATEGIERLQALLAERGVFVRRLRVQVPFHSCFMDSLREEMLASTASVRPCEPRVPLYSTVTGAAVRGAAHDHAYWFANMRETVRFAQAIAGLVGEGYADFMEISPHPVLASSIGECAAANQAPAKVITTLHRERDERQQMAAAVAQAYCAGASPAWERRLPAADWVRLPRYPWRKERYWQETPASQRNRVSTLAHPLLKRRLDTEVPTWESDLDSPLLAFLQDHCIEGTVVFPGAGYVDMAISAARSLLGENAALALADVRFERALYLSGDELLTLRITVDPQAGTVRIASRVRDSADPEWRLHCTGTIRFDSGAREARADLAAIAARCPVAIAPERCYDYFRGFGLQYGPLFRGIAGLQQGQREALAEVEVPAELRPAMERFAAHPAVLDLCFQTLAAALPFETEGSVVYMPTGFSLGRSHGPLPARLSIHAVLTQRSAEGISGDVRVFDPSGELLLEIAGCTARVLGGGGGFVETPQKFYRPAWWAQDAAAPVEATAPGCWLLLGGQRDGVGHRIGERLRALGHQCVDLDAREGFDPHSLQAWSQALGGPEQALPVRGVIQLAFGESPRMDADAGAERVLDAVGQGCLATLNASKALAALPALEKPRLWIVTRAAQKVADSDRPDPFTGAVWGLGRVIGHNEHIEVWGGLIDLEAAGTEAAEVEAERVLADCLSGEREDQIAWRGGQRRIMRLEQLDDVPQPALLPRLRSDASYLVTGGLGALGMVVAEWMVERGARHLVLTGRSALPPRALWGALAPDHPQQKLVAQLLGLERAGAQVAVECFDIADAAALQAVLDRREQEGRPPVRGVIHSAGVARPQLVAQLDNAEFMSAMPPKVLGAWNLHRAFDGQPLDFFVLFSSVAALVTSVGQGNYASANTFLDLLAEHRRASGQAATSIGWGPWGDVGMATQLDLLTYFHNRGMYPMSAAQGCQALGRLLLGQGLAQALVLGAKWTRVAESSPLGIPAPMNEHVIQVERSADDALAQHGADQAVGIHERLAACEDAQSLEQALAEHVRDLACRILRADPADMSLEDSIANHGMDSMMAIELKNRIEHSLKASVSVVDLLKGGSPRQIAGLLAGQIQADRDALHDAAVAEVLAQMSELSAQQIQSLLAESEENGA